MGTPTANVSRRTFDATRAYKSVRLQQGVPITDADWNELQDNLDWQWSRAFDALIGFDTTQVTVDDALYEFINVVDPVKSWPTDAPTVAATPTSWFPGSMRPWVHTAGLSNDYYVMWGPSYVQGLFVEDFDQRGPAGLYSSIGHVITTGTVTALPGGTTIEDDSKDFTPAGGDLHLTGAAGGVGNGTARPCRVRFTSGPEAGNTYNITAIPTSARLTLSGGAPAVGNTFLVLPNTITFVNGQVEKAWLCVWLEDIDDTEDTNLLEPTMLLEPSHRLKLRYWHRILRQGATQPTTADRPDYPDLAPQGHEEKVYWIEVATITPGAGAPTIVPADIVYSTPGHYELSPLGPILQALKSKLNLSTGEMKDVKFADDMGPGASLAANQHPLIHTGTEGVRFPSLSANALSKFIEIDHWDGATNYRFFEVAGWKSTLFDGGVGVAMFADALVGRSQSAGSDGKLYVGATEEVVNATLGGFIDTAGAFGKAWAEFTASDEGAGAIVGSAKLRANWSTNGTNIGLLDIVLDPSFTDPTAHSFIVQTEKTLGADIPTAYVLDLRAPVGITDGFAALKIAGKTGSGSHFAQGETALQVLTGDVIFGSIGSPMFFFDDSANLLQFNAAGGTVDFNTNTGVGLYISSLGAIARLGKSADTRIEIDDTANTVVLHGTGGVTVDNQLNASEDVQIADTKRVKFATARRRRQALYMNEFGVDSGDFASGFLPGNVAPANAASYTTSIPPGSTDAWPAALFDAGTSSPVTGFFQLEAHPGETLERITFGVSASGGTWDLYVYRIDDVGGLVLVSTNTGDAASAGAGIREVIVDLTSPVTVAGTNPLSLVLKVVFNHTADRYLFRVRPRWTVDNFEESIGIADS